MLKTLDSLGTLTSPLGLRRTPTANWRSWGRYMFRPMAITFFALSLILNTNAANAATRPQMEMKLFALNALKSWEDFECYNELIFRESRWNPKAKNGSHYGLGQMRNEKVKELGWQDQIRWHLKYIKHRYAGSPCKALNHLLERGWH